MSSPRFTATATTTTSTVERRGVSFPAMRVTCSCATCKDRAVLVPAATVASAGTKAALHNYVAQARVLGFPAA